MKGYSQSQPYKLNDLNLLVNHDILLSLTVMPIGNYENRKLYKGNEHFIVSNVILIRYWTNKYTYGEKNLSMALFTKDS